MNENVLLNPNWFWDHKYTPIVSYLKNKEFIEECKKFCDDNQNTLLHYLFMNCKKFDQMTFLVMKWLICNGLNVNDTNKSRMTPFYYYINFIFENELSETTGFDKYFLQILNYYDNESIHENGNTFLHLLTFCPFVYKHKDIIKSTIDLHLDKLSKKNNNKQIPLYIAMSYWRENKNVPLLYYIFLKTPIHMLNSFDIKGRNCFHLACEYSQSTIIDFLMAKDKKIISNTKILNEKRDPIVFTVVKNADLDFIKYLLLKLPEIFTEKNCDEKNVMDTLFDSFIINTDKSEIYKKIFMILVKNQTIKSSLPNVKDIYSKIKSFELYQNYECMICMETKDLRDWERPFCCENHAEKMHKSCFEKWYKISRSCPICDYKNENFFEPHGYKFEVENCVCDENSSN